MEMIRILFAFGFLAPGYYAMEIQTSILPRNLDVYCKVCDGISAAFDNFSYEDYDFWRTIDIHDKIRFFCSFCKKKTESTTLPTTTRSTTSSETPSPASTNPTSQSGTPSSAPVTTSSTPATSLSSTGTTTAVPETTTQTTPRPGNGSRYYSWD